MNKYKVVIGIIMTVVTLSCIIASSFAWFMVGQDTVKGEGGGFTAQSQNSVTVGDVFTIQDMGNYQGQTSFSFYRYIEDPNNDSFNYILDENNNKITRTFTYYEYEAEMRENRTFEWSGTQENVGIYSLRVTVSNVSEVSANMTFFLVVKNNDNYSEPADSLYFDSGNTLKITDTDGNNAYDNMFDIINLDSNAKTISVRPGGESNSFTCSIGVLNQNYTNYINNDNTTTVYDRLGVETQRYSVTGINGSVLYDSKNSDTTISFDKDEGLTKVSKIVRNDKGDCKKIYRDEDGNLTMENEKFRIVRYATEIDTIYRIYDKMPRPNCIYDGELDGVTISVSEKEIVTYAVDDGTGMEDSAYNTAIQFEMFFNSTAGQKYFLQFTPNTLGIVPASESAKEKLLAIDGTTISDIYYTFVDTEVLFGLEVSEEYKNDTVKTTTVKNYTSKIKDYDGETTTVTTTTMNRLENANVNSKLRYETTKGYDVYYSSNANGSNAKPLTLDVDKDAVMKFVDVNGNGKMIPYDQDKHGGLRYALRTIDGYELYVRDDLESSDVLDDKGALIDEAYRDSLIFVYDANGNSKCAVYNKITDKNRDCIDEVLNDTSLNFYTAQSESTVCDTAGNVLCSKGKGNEIATNKKSIYFLPLSAFFDYFTLEVSLINHSDISKTEWENMSAEDRNKLIKTYRVNKEGMLVDENGDQLMLDTSSSTMQLYCVARVYYADPYTLDNMHSEEDLTYNYDYNLPVPMYTVESTGNLNPFAFSDYAFMGSHFLIRLSVGNGQREAGN